MKIYKVSQYSECDDGEHVGFTYVSNKKEALKIKKNNKIYEDEIEIIEYEDDIEIIEVDKLTKKELINILNTHASHPNNG